MPQTPPRRSRRARRSALLAACLGMTAMPMLAPAATLPAGSITTNPSLDSSTSGWSGYQAKLSLMTAADAPLGTGVAKVTRSTGTYFTIDDLPDTVPSAVAGTVYNAEAWVKAGSSSSVGNPIYLRIRERAPSGAVVKEWSSPAGKLGSSYVRLAISGTVVATGDSIDVRVSHTSAGTGDAFLVDAISLVPVGATAPPPPPPPSVTDLTPPTVALTAPAQGATLVGSVPVTADALDDTAVDRVEFYVNGKLRWTERYAPYKLGTTGMWDTTAETNGSYTVEARAFDSSGNVSSARVSVTVANVVAPPPPSAMLDAETYPFEPTAAVNQPIPDGIASDPRSDAIIGQLTENMRIGRVFLNDRDEVPPVYTATSSDPWYTTTVGGRAVRFRVPASASTGSGADFPMVIQDPAHPDYGPSTELRLWQASINTSTRTLTASGSGLFHYNNDGVLYNGVRSLGQPFLGWGTGSGLTITYGLVRPEEVQAGEIRHAIRFSYSARDFIGGYRAPALKTDQPKGTTTRDANTAMVMGMRLQLDPTLDCNTRTVPGVSSTSPETRTLRIVCRALQRYGMIAIDGTADRNMVLMMENTATANWGAVAGAERNGSYSQLIRDMTAPSDGLTRDANSGIPWGRMRVLSVSVFPTS